MSGRSSASQVGGLSALLTTLDNGCRGIAHVMALAGGWAVVLMAAMITVDVAMRAISGGGLDGAVEISGYLMSISITWGLGAAFYARSHIRIDILYVKFAQPLRIWLDLLSILSLLGVALFLIYSSGLVLQGSLQQGSRSASTLQVPMWIPESLWLFGTVVFALSLTVSLVRGLWDVLSGHGVMVEERHGVITAKEEAEDAVHQSNGDL